jgi:hypothetical protein
MKGFGLAHLFGALLIAFSLIFVIHGIVKGKHKPPALAPDRSTTATQVAPTPDKKP